MQRRVRLAFAPVEVVVVAAAAAVVVVVVVAAAVAGKPATVD